MTEYAWTHEAYWKQVERAVAAEAERDAARAEAAELRKALARVVTVTVPVGHPELRAKLLAAACTCGRGREHPVYHDKACSVWQPEPEAR